MTVMIHGKQYVTCAERVQEAHKCANLTIQTTIAVRDGDFKNERIIVKAIVITPKGTFTGWAEEVRGIGGLVKNCPIEICETSAVARALGFAGFGSVESIANADEIISKAKKESAEVFKEAEDVFFPPEEKEAPSEQEEYYECQGCAKLIEDDKIHKADDIVAYSKRTYKKILCKDCQKKAKKKKSA